MFSTGYIYKKIEREREMKRTWRKHRWRVRENVRRVKLRKKAKREAWISSISRKPVESRLAYLCSYTMCYFGFLILYMSIKIFLVRLMKRQCRCENAYIRFEREQISRIKSQIIRISSTKKILLNYIVFFNFYTYFKMYWLYNLFIIFLKKLVNKSLRFKYLFNIF